MADSRAVAGGLRAADTPVSDTTAALFLGVPRELAELHPICGPCHGCGGWEWGRYVVPAAELDLPPRVLCPSCYVAAPVAVVSGGDPVGVLSPLTDQGDQVAEYMKAFRPRPGLRPYAGVGWVEEFAAGAGEWHTVGGELVEDPDAGTAQLIPHGDSPASAVRVTASAPCEDGPPVVTEVWLSVVEADAVEVRLDADELGGPGRTVRLELDEDPDAGRVVLLAGDRVLDALPVELHVGERVHVQLVSSPAGPAAEDVCVWLNGGRVLVVATEPPRVRGAFAVATDGPALTFGPVVQHRGDESTHSNHDEERHRADP